MKIKEYRLYFDEIMENAKKETKKNKIQALLFTGLIALLIVIPFVCIFTSFYLQFLGFKIAYLITFIIIAALLHFLISIVIPLYYYCLNLITKSIDDFSFKKLFIVHLTDWVTIVMLIIFVIVMFLFISFMMF